ncbi:DUF6292 family protein [Saccharothrix variisporea]|uniref:DUF6292 domain-containing protein n=1 Tax=Saccharothrix variisporea TaxID=543527 RepID=A0A495X612_9PSEU|nr:DUF6292 family protein [Saccharothrix variisporea]RKT66958.1 hypothetical protein DFJ66_0124 [Saccharothrix variisporea]
MTVVVPLPTDQQAAVHLLHGYLTDVAAALGVGPESCTVDQDTPVSAYLALDTHLPTHPDRDLALLWDERTGWAAAVETHSGEDLIVVDHLDDPDLLPPPHRVARFVRTLHTEGPRHRDPRHHRTATTHAALARLLRRRPNPDLAPGRHAHPAGIAAAG